MAAKTFEELVEEIHENAVRDRKRLESYVDQVGRPHENLDPEVAAALAESMVDISEALTRNNAQLVEVAKILMKKKLSTKNDDDFSGDEADEVFEEIEDELEDSN